MGLHEYPGNTGRDRGPGERRHEYATLEHLLLALVEDQDAAAVMRACNVDLDTLRRTLVEYVDNELANLVSDGRQDSKPTAGFQRVIQRVRRHFPRVHALAIGDLPLQRGGVLQGATLSYETWGEPAEEAALSS